MIAKTSGQAYLPGVCFFGRNDAMPAITSPENHLIKQMKRLLSSRRARCESGLFVVEGARLVYEAATENIPVDTLLYTEQGRRRLGEDCPSVLTAAKRHYLIDDAVAKRISDTQTPQGVFAVCSFRLTEHALPHTVPGGALVLSSLQDPGNVGTILRSADAFGISMVIMSPDCPDPGAPKVLRASMGAAFRVPMAVADPFLAVEFLKSQNIRVYAAALDDYSKPINAVSLADSAVVIGNEGAGLPASLIARCDESVVIPISPGCESLNAAMAATVFCYEMRRARGAYDVE